MVKKILAGVLAIGIVLGALWFLFAPSDSIVPTKPLFDQAEQKWQTLNIKSYKIDIRWRVLSGYTYRARTTVQNNKVVSVEFIERQKPENDKSGDTVEGLFRIAKHYFGYGFTPEMISESWKVTFDPVYFYPKIIDFRKNEKARDDFFNIYWEVLSFEVLPNPSP